ncbi:MAG: hypothetical protein U0840_13715 [Gemmataceae bacterium]
MGLPQFAEEALKGGAPGYRPFDQMQALGERAGVTAANFKKFRHSPRAHGKQHFGMTAEQMRAAQTYYY